MRIREGKNLPRMDDIGLSDPYVIVKACGQEKRTEVREVTRTDPRILIFRP